MGITVGYHRLLTHRAFQTYKPIEYTVRRVRLDGRRGAGDRLGLGPPRHHAHADHDGDPHSPHGHGDGFGGTLRGLWHAHLGWLFDHPPPQDADKHAPDLVEDRGMRAMHRLFGPFVIAGLAIPFLAGWGISGELGGRPDRAVLGGAGADLPGAPRDLFDQLDLPLLRPPALRTDDHSTNVFWLALPSFGESWHHNHHAFPRSALHGLRWWELDPGGWVIRGMKRLGLAWNVVLITKDRQRQKAAQAAQGARPTAEAGV